ncbi:MAG: efflux RND transporter periplasmic adaptor subunit [Planctomycetota bacterium]
MACWLVGWLVAPLATGQLANGRAFEDGASFGATSEPDGRRVLLEAFFGTGIGGEFRAVSRPSEHRGLAFPVRGRVREVMVEPGDRVEAGTPLIKLEDALERASLQLAAIRAADETQIETAERLMAFRQTELDLTLQSNSGGGASGRDLREARLNHDRAVLDVQAAYIARAEAEAGLARERLRVEELTIVAPVGGEVLSVSKRAGEGVDELTSVVTLVNIDPLILELNVPPAVALGMENGQAALVVWDDVPGPAEVGQVVFRAPVGDAGARRILVRVEVPNPGRLPSGLHARVRVAEASAAEVRERVAAGLAGAGDGGDGAADRAAASARVGAALVNAGRTVDEGLSGALSRGERP